MSIKTFKPTTPSRRQMTVSGFDGIDKKAKPEPSLTEPLKKSSGRNSYGRITVRHRGGGNKRKYRVIDFKRDKIGSAVVLRLEYDPNRSANIALIQYEDGEKRYILAPVGLKAGHKIMTGPDADILPGNADPQNKGQRQPGTHKHNKQCAQRGQNGQLQQLQRVGKGLPQRQQPLHQRAQHEQQQVFQRFGGIARRRGSTAPDAHQRVFDPKADII